METFGSYLTFGMVIALIVLVIWNDRKHTKKIKELEREIKGESRYGK